MGGVLSVSGWELSFSIFVIPAKAGTQSVRRLAHHWVPAFAGMTR